MRKPKSYSVLEVLNFTDVGLRFQFYSTKEPKFIVEALGKLTGKNIILTNEALYSPSYSNAILIKEYEATRSRYEFCIAPQNYHSILPIIDEVTGWLSENCSTSYDTGLKTSISFNHRHLDTLQSISQMNPAKLILKFDENFVYQRFPEQKGSPYALSIKSLTPSSSYINESEIENHIQNILNTSFAKYYGINFKDYTRGILECNYIGGNDYTSKPKQIKDILEYFIFKTYQSVNEEEISDFEKYEIKRLTESFDKIQMSYWDPDIFLKEFQDLKVYVDLKTSQQILKTYWNQIRTPLFEMIINGELKEGQFNYDTDVGRFQLKKGRVSGTLVKNMDFVSCDITGVLENCNFVSCNINKARVYNSRYISKNVINESYLEGASINAGNEVKNSYIVNNEEVINCKVSNSLVKFATVGKRMKVDENSTVIVKEMPMPKPNDAVRVEEIRDYTYIKSMNKTGDKGFENEYKKDTYNKNKLKDNES